MGAASLMKRAAAGRRAFGAVLNWSGWGPCHVLRGMRSYKPLSGEVFAPTEFPPMLARQSAPEQVCAPSIWPAARPSAQPTAHLCPWQTLELAHVYGFDTRAWRALAFISDDEIAYAVGCLGGSSSCAGVVVLVLV